MGCVVWKLITRRRDHHMMPRPLVSSFGSRDAKNDTSPSATTTELRAAAAAAVAYNRVEYHTLFLLKQNASCKSIKFIVI